MHFPAPLVSVAKLTRFLIARCSGSNRVSMAEILMNQRKKHRRAQYCGVSQIQSLVER